MNWTPEKFNAEYPIGTQVWFWPGVKEGTPLISKTRSAAWLIGQEPVVSVENYAGGIALTHIEVVGDPVA